MCSRIRGNNIRYDPTLTMDEILTGPIALSAARSSGEFDEYRFIRLVACSCDVRELQDMEDLVHVYIATYESDLVHPNAICHH